MTNRVNVGSTGRDNHTDAGVPAGAVPRGRIGFIDVAKAIGIVLVVVGHTPGIPAAWVVMIYSFHMPLFFFVSGYLQPVSAGRDDTSLGITRTARSLLVPYVVFFGVSLAYWLATRHLGDRASKFGGVGVGDAFVGLWTGVSNDLFVNQALWFLPCLFVCTVVFRLLQRFATPGRLLAGALVACSALLAFVHPLAQRWPWGLDILPVVLLFFAAGHGLRVHAPAWPGSLPPVARIAAWLVCLLLWGMLAPVAGRVDLGRAYFGVEPGLYVPVAALGIAATLLASSLIPAHAALRWLSAQSIVIFPLHPLLINAMSGALKFAKAHGAPIELGTPAVALAIAAASIVVLVPVANLLSRRVPQLIGRERRTAGTPRLRGLLP